ncbi:polyprenyl synthetase family protein [Aldersonia kunmingensis]|uniref:polyprenyl synthetase family protein n=1 Tax=Aldersonia kunmingensis TaxID=408066 RepID=UPI000A004B47|nr:polyprenyl synthetase family protein [Aldersonia kunmingensis]
MLDRPHYREQRPHPLAAEATLTIGPSPSLAATADPATFASAVEAELTAFFASRRGIVAGVGTDFVAAVDELEQFVLRGGKRIRPTFAWTGWLGAGADPVGADAEAVLRVCSALELVQACALVHDDIIDSSDTRRGHPTVHVTFAQRHLRDGWAGGSESHGAAVAILLGDVALAWSDDMVREAGLPPDAAARLAPVWSAMRTEVLGGQLLDITGESRGDESVEAAMRINRYKTAAYTIERPLHIGAALAGAPESLVGAYRQYGTDVGIAFQLRDDLLGVFGDPATTGKPSGDDLREGKRTVLFAFALQRADEQSPETAALLRRSIGTELTNAAVDELRGVLTDLGAVDEVERRITELTERGLAAVEDSPATPAAKRQLREMADAATRRSA